MNEADMAEDLQAILKLGKIGTRFRLLSEDGELSHDKIRMVDVKSQVSCNKHQSLRIKN